MSASKGKTLRPNLKAIRAQSGLTQEELARLLGLSRQSLNQIENGSAVPSTAIALQLASALGCRVEDLFSLREERELRASLAQPLADSRGAPSARVVLGWLGGRWVAHQLNPQHRARDLTIAADALLVGRAPDAGRSAKAPVRLKPLADPLRLQDNLLVAGCDSALSILAQRAARGSSPARSIWLEAASGAALGALARSEVHIAGAHLFDEETGEYNVPFVRRAVPGRATVVITLAQIEEGLALPKGNPRRIKKVSQLDARGLRIINREKGAGARRLLDRLLERAGIAGGQIAGYEKTAPGHFEAAQAVAQGAADAAMVTCSAALAFGLEFVPLASERFDLALPKDLLTDARVTRFLDVLTSGGFRQELQSIGGYQTRRSGSIAAELS